MKKILEYDQTRRWEVYLPNDGSLERHEVLQCQIEEYDAARRDILLMVHVLEQYILKNYQGSREDLQSGGGVENFRSYVDNGLIKGILGNSAGIEKDGSADLLVVIRNKFAHNELPDKKWFDLCTEHFRPMQGSEMYAEYFCRAFCAILHELVPSLTPPLCRSIQSED